MKLEDLLHVHVSSVFCTHTICILSQIIASVILILANFDMPRSLGLTEVTHMASYM